MHILKIRAENFRNYRYLQLEPHPRLNIITGLNAQGKTNLLEAIFFNLCGYSFRTKNLRDIINWQSEYCCVISELKKEGRQWKQSLALNKKGKKKILINSVERTNKDLNHSGVIIFTPDDLTLIKNSPAERRRFLDLEVGPFYPAYKQAIQQYNKVLFHRNHLLKNIKANKNKDNTLLEIWDQQLIIHGTNVLLGRLAVLKKLAPLAVKWYNLMTGGQEDLEIRYLSSLQINPTADDKSIKAYFQKMLNELHYEEIKKCQTLVGPHRDDIIFFINDKEARKFGSQGQQRTLVLSLKLAQLSLWEHEYQSHPILLLDDVLFELDSKRQEFLLSKINQGIQTFVTTNQLYNRDYLGNDYKLLEINSGKVSVTQ
ncbi:MAG: DNA replication/repair protein RecF [Desulfotomaculum sp.]|nr:DNA replication/repair protein RecF [Desulfotomaculum sp.]